MDFFRKTVQNEWNFENFETKILIAPDKTALEQVLERINIVKIIASICSTQNQF